MKEIIVTSTSELRHVLADLNNHVLFRGQVSCHETDGCPSVVTSFDRRGCIPSQMMKWCRYADNVLDAYIGKAGASPVFTQALLQHYGWRSFYVDCSVSASVAAWFASHVYSERQIIDLCEDCEEQPVMLVKRMASYEFAEGDGHLYVFDKAFAEKHVGATELAVLKIEGVRPRTERQDAWLLGPLRNKEVPLDCFIAHITASRAIFRDYAAEEGLVETDRLFPSTQDDPILRALLGLPWKKIDHPENNLGIPVFRRALDLPEYQDSFVKIASPGTAFFQGARVADHGSVDGDKYGGITVHVPEIALFGTADEAPLSFPKVSEMLAAHRSVAFEIDDLIQHVELRGKVIYQKGIAVTAHEPRLIELCELSVEHPGLDMTGAGMNRGWFYRVDDDGVGRGRLIRSNATAAMIKCTFAIFPLCISLKRISPLQKNSTNCCFVVLVTGRNSRPASPMRQNPAYIAKASG